MENEIFNFSSYTNTKTKTLHAKTKFPRHNLSSKYVVLKFHEQSVTNLKSLSVREVKSNQ